MPIRGNRESEEEVNAVENLSDTNKCQVINHLFPNPLPLTTIPRPYCARLTADRDQSSKRKKDTDRQTDRQTDGRTKQTDRPTDRQTERKKKRKKERKTERKKDKRKERKKERQK